jgi:hypothetical protein
MSTNNRYWQPPGLTALQFQLSIILRHLDEQDYPTAIDAMKHLALITAELDVISQVEDFCKITDRQKELNQSVRTFNAADKITPYKATQEYLKQRSYYLLKLIMKLCDKHGITIKHPRDLATNMNTNRPSQLFGEESQASP